jgi:hypothetical protein
MDNVDPSYPPQTTPFKTDLILRSSDGTLFHVHSVILSMSSPVFRDMLTVPTNPDTQDDPVELTENAKVLSTLLNIVYPNKHGFEIDCLVDLVNVKYAAEKYDMQNVVQDLQAFALGNADTHREGWHCVAMYSIAQRFGWENVARAACEASLTRRLFGDRFSILSAESLGDAIPLVDVTSLLKLQDWHNKRTHCLLAFVRGINRYPQRTHPVYAEYLSWESLHENHDCVAHDETLLKLPAYDGHSSKVNLENALELFKIRLVSALEDQPAGKYVRDCQFWLRWEFEGLKCVHCNEELLSKRHMQDHLLRFVGTMPRHPDGEWF